MGEFGLEKQVERINWNRNFTLDCLKETMPNSVEKIESEKYFIATMVITDKPDKFYTIIDLTSKQVEHLHDFDEYCVEIYNSLVNCLKC